MRYALLCPFGTDKLLPRTFRPIRNPVCQKRLSIETSAQDLPTLSPLFETYVCQAADPSAVIERMGKPARPNTPTTLNRIMAPVFATGTVRSRLDLFS